jgi:hypothetical protein
MISDFPEVFLCNSLSGGIVMSIAYGHEIAPENDEYIALAETNNALFSKAIRPGAFLVDIFPIRELLVWLETSRCLTIAVKYVPEWCPGAGFQKVAKVARQNVYRAREVPFRDVKARMVCDFQRQIEIFFSILQGGRNS